MLTFCSFRLSLLLLLFTIFYSLFTIHRLLLLQRQRSTLFGYSLFTICHSLSSSLFIIHFSLFRYFTIHYLIFTIHYSLFVIFCVRKLNFFSEVFDDFCTSKNNGNCCVIDNLFFSINARRLLRVEGGRGHTNPLCSMHN